MADIDNKLCPFRKMKACDPRCMLRRQGLRHFDDPVQKPILVDVCALNQMTDCLENLIMRNIGLQTEMNVLRNNMEKTVQGFLQLEHTKKALGHAIEHEVTKRLIEDKQERIEVIEVKEREPEDGETEVSEG